KALTARSGTVDSMPSEPVHDSFLSGNPGPEARLLLCCARTEIGPEIAARIEALARLPLDWDFVCASADKHRLTQLLFRNLSAICPASVPPEVRKRLRHRFYTNAGANLKLAHMLAGLVQSFGETPIPVIPFKGSVLAHETYGKLSL